MKPGARVDPAEQVSAHLDQLLQNRRLSRREFLRLCEIGAVGAVLTGCAGAGVTSSSQSSSSSTPSTSATTTTSVAAAAPAPNPAMAPAPAPAPTRSVMGPPYPDGDGTVSTTPTSASGIAIAEKNSSGQYTGVLRAAVSAQIRSKNTMGAGGVARAWVRIPYTQLATGGGTATTAAGESWKGAVVVNFTKNPLSDDSADPDPYGGCATSFAIVTAVVRDLTAGSEVTILVERYMCNATVGEYSMDERSWQYSNAPVNFIVGHDYEIDVMLTARADVACLNESQTGGTAGRRSMLASW